MMYNPMAYWGQRDLIPQILVEYGTRNNSYTTVTYTLEGKLLSASIAPFTGSGSSRTSPLTKICQDFVSADSVRQNPVDGTFGGTYEGPYMFTQPYFCSTTSKDGLSGFGPIEAWYLDITNNTGADGYVDFPLYMQYIDKDGNFASASVTYPNTVRILTQTYPMTTEIVRRVNGVPRWFVTPVQKYLGNVKPYPYKDLPVRYDITTPNSQTVLYHLTGSAGIDTDTGIGVNTTGGVTTTLTSFNIPEVIFNNTSPNVISINSIVSASNYNVIRCSDNATASISLVAGSPVYSSGSVLYLTGSNAISGCYGITSKITSSVQYQNLTVVNSYPNCTACEDDVRFYNVNLNGGNIIGSGYSLSYIDFNGISRTSSLPTFGNIYKFIARSGSISTTYGGSTTITELSPIPTTNNNLNISGAAGGTAQSTIMTYQSSSGTIHADYYDFGFNYNVCAVSSSFVGSWAPRFTLTNNGNC